MNTRIPAGFKLVPTEPTAAIIAAAASAVWPAANAADIAMAREAAPIVLMTADLGAGMTADMLAASIATMAPAYRAMVAVASAPADPSGELLVACITLHGTTLTIEPHDMADMFGADDEHHSYELTFKRMTRAAYDALGEFNGF